MAKYNKNNASSDIASGPSTMSRVAWASLVLSLASQASAFHTAPREPLWTGSVHSGPVSRASDVRTSRSRRAMTPTALKYANDSMTTDTTKGWWSNIFQSRKVDEQENVDEYLEFLDRRYNRLRSSEEEGDAKPLSALSWLLNGSPSRNDVRAEAQKEEDALYVLGVAGLASERLLQKHHLSPEEIATQPRRRSAQPKVERKAEVIDISPVEDTRSTLFIKKVVVPVIRKYVIVQQAKNVFVNAQLKRARAFGLAFLKVVAKSLAQGPISTANGIMDLGGGKQNIAVTISAVSTVLLLLRPVLQAVITETSAAATISP
eukprot:CAMPEP_0116996692 /NCGR_PEP_ID=MMETSP0472-20121206/408_1 /TAXON_ID=693140 ORGANISM="Tiarina fusus, Strain LIS" /NCGR_SAMPLE_ID=MMETSP0472 /ASSEMBLY_ACC=CAM_ASM_000603 /LENGTH=317 /DNA_ID=CAMNT_0004695387 /DNA_START=63 /DNA_END=1016 /DNA_ORIENTATION=-